MNIKYRQLKAFSLAARLSSFAEAAHAMAVTPASFSSLIKELEIDLDVILFDRSTRRCALTEAGRTFRDQMVPALTHVESLYREMTDTGKGIRGRLTVVALPSLLFSLVPRALAQYRRDFPDVQIVLQERTNEDVFDAVRQREMEIGLGSLVRPDSALVYRPLVTDRMMLIVPPGHALARARVTWRSLETQPYILISSGFSEHVIRTSALHITPAFVVEHVATAVSMVRHGMGVTALPSTVIPAFNVQGMICVPIQGRLATRTLGVAYRRGAKLSTIAENFIAALSHTIA